MTHDLKTSLEDLAEAEYAGAPASAIDIGRARAAGRRRMLTARLAPVGGGVAVAVACVLVANALGGTSPAGHGPRPADSSPAGRPELTGTDPLRAVAKFGWLPEGFQVAGHGTGPFYGTSVTAQTEPQPSGAAGGSMPVKLTVTSSAAEPTLPSYETRKKVTVAGSPNAYLVTNPGDGPSVPADLSLRWQTASGSWFTLGGDYQIHGDPLQALLIRVAESVTADDSAVPLPFHIEGLPKDAILGEATLNNPVTVGREGFTAALLYTDGQVSGGHGTFTVSASTVTDPRQSTTSPAACKVSEGVRICVLDNPGSDDALASVGGAQGLLNRITSLGADPSRWTTHVVN